MTWRRWLQKLFRHNSAERELDEELQAHLTIEARQRLEAGETPEKAHAAALKDFGSVALVKETTRDMWGWTSLEHLVQDLRYALRMLRKNPGFTATAILSLALGIGATAAVFTVLNAAILRPLPVADPQRLVILQPQQKGKQWILFNPLFEGISDRQRSLTAIFAVSDESHMKVQFEGAAGPVYLPASVVSGTYFSTLGVSPAAGRFFTALDDRIPGAAGSTGCAAVISHAFWVRQFQKDEKAIGAKLRVRDTDCTIVGVAPADFRSHQPGFAPDLWAPMRQVTDAALLANHNLAFFSGIMGRLKPGVSSAQAEAELTALYQQLQAAEPPPPARSGNQPIPPGDVTMRVVPGARGLELLKREFSQPLVLVLGVVAIILLIASINVANLLLARGALRAMEFATRAALGAGRARLIRQLATEGCLLAILGAFLGVALAWLATPALASVISVPWLPIVLDIEPDSRVIAISLAATTVAALLAGLLPALRLSRTSLHSGMAAASRTTDSRSSRRLVRTLVVVQLALSLLLLAGAGLLLQTMLRIHGVDPGFRPEHVVILDVRHEAPRQQAFSVVDELEEKTQLAALYQRLEERLIELPGVRSASMSWLGLFGGSDLWLRLLISERPDDKRGAHVDYVSPHYFETVGMQMKRGRGFTIADREGAERVAVVNEALAKERLDGTQAIGRRVALDYGEENKRPFTIVGIVRDSKYNNLREKETDPMIWIPLAQMPVRIKSVMLRVQPGTEAAAVRQAQTALASADPLLMVRKVTTLSTIVEGTTARERLMLVLAASFGCLALLLASIGLYGTLAYAVARRTREIGVRLVLGAQPGKILRSVVGEAIAFIVWALILGLPLALVAGYTLRAFLFGVESHDVSTLAGACLVLCVTAIAAAYIPARRAAGVDPVTALRCE